MAKATIKHPHQLKAIREARAEPGICLYVDNSNIFIEGQRFGTSKGENRQAVRLHFQNFVMLASRRRVIREVVWGGSIPPEQDDVWRHLKVMCIEPDLIPRSRSGENQTVDQAIQLRMHRHVRKYRDSPSTIVLCTGDGRGYHREEGFFYDVTGFVEDGWKLEVLSWEHACHQQLKEFAIRNGVYVPLGEFYESITFIERGRTVLPVDYDELQKYVG